MQEPEGRWGVKSLPRKAGGLPGSISVPCPSIAGTAEAEVHGLLSIPFHPHCASAGGCPPPLQPLPLKLWEEGEP